MSRLLTPEEKEFADEMLAGLPPFVAREQVDYYTGGLVAPKTLANADSAGLGPDEARAIGRKIAYPKKALVNWMITFLGIRQAGVSKVKRTPKSTKNKQLRVSEA